MDKIVSRLTVFFENPFWVGIFECESQKNYEVCKIVFGAEPKDYEVYEFLLKNHHRLEFSRQKLTEKSEQKHLNPKRMQKEIKKQLENKGAGTKAQQALKAAYEQSKAENKTLSKERIEAEKEHRFELKQQKKKEKHRGR